VIDALAAIAEFNRILRRVLPANINLSLIGRAGAPYVVADRSHLEQVVMNLCVNAADAMPDGGRISVTLDRETVTDAYATAHAWARPGEYVTIAVADTGSGIAAELLPHIFEPFFTTKEIGKGTGLGLATVYGIVQRYDGLIDVQSEVGRGTTFRIFLPAHETSPADDEQAERVAGAPGRNELILVAEDEPLVRDLAVSQLERAGYRVLQATDGESAVRLFEAHAEDIRLAFLDVMMPRGDGRFVRQAIRARRPTVPILFATGYAELERRQTAADTLSDPIIQKPYSIGALLTKIRELLDASPADAR
jgi:CheY-like chemotaxis protein